MIDVSAGPAFKQIAKELRVQITSGALPPGAQLPSMAQLREKYLVSNTVIRDVLNELRRDGLVVGQQGKGVFVRADAAAVASADTDVLLRLASLEELVAALDARVSRLEGSGRASRAPGGHE